MLARNFAVLYVILPILDTVDLNGTLFLWTLGNRRMLARNFAVLYVILPILDTVGLNGTLFLWTLGNP